MQFCLIPEFKITLKTRIIRYDAWTEMQLIIHFLWNMYVQVDGDIIIVWKIIQKVVSILQRLKRDTLCCIIFSFMCWNWSIIVLFKMAEYLIAMGKCLYIQIFAWKYLYMYMYYHLLFCTKKKRAHIFVIENNWFWCFNQHINGEIKWNHYKVIAISIKKKMNKF